METAFPLKTSVLLSPHNFYFLTTPSPNTASKYSGRRYYNQDNMFPGHRKNYLHKIKTNLSRFASSPGKSYPPIFARKNQHYFKQTSDIAGTACF